MDIVALAVDGKVAGESEGLEDRDLVTGDGVGTGRGNLTEDGNLEVFILKIEQDEEGNDVYTVPDDDVADAVFEKLVKLTEDLGEEE